MNKNIKISDIDFSKLLNGEINSDGIKIEDKFVEFNTTSFDDKFNYIRAEVEVQSNNELKNKGNYVDEYNNIIEGNYPINVTFCKNGKIETVDKLDNINLRLFRNIDNVFPFNEICLVTKTVTNFNGENDGIEESTWIDSAYPNRGYYVTNDDFLPRDYWSGERETYVPKELKSNSRDNAFLQMLEYQTDCTTKTFVRIPKFYLRIYFFENKKDNKYYRRYEIISPSVYDSLSEELNFGFFVPKAFGDKRYLYISHTPESFGLISSPFGSETGFFDVSNQIINEKLNHLNIMTSDVWFGIIHILFKIYIGYMNPRSLLGYPTYYNKQWDGVNSIFSIFHKHQGNTISIFDTDINNKSILKLDVFEDIFVSESNELDPPLKYIISNNSTPCADMKGFVYRNNFNSSSTEIQNNIFTFDAFDYSSSENYLITNIVLWNAAPSSSLDDNDNTPIYCDFSITIKSSENNGTYYFNCYRYRNRSEVNPVLEEIKNNRISFTKDTTLGKIFVTIQLNQNLENNLFTSGNASIQYVVFKERYTGDKKKIVKDTLLGKNLVLCCWTNTDVPNLSKQGECAYIEAQFYDPDDSSTTTNYIQSCNINFLNYEFGTQGNFKREYDDINIKKFFDAWNMQDCCVCLYRHPVHEIAGNYYNSDKRFFVDLYKKNYSIGCRFSLLYFSNFILPYSYKKDNVIKDNSFYPKYISRYNMPNLGDDEVCIFEKLEAQQGVLLNDISALTIQGTTPSQRFDLYINVSDGANPSSNIIEYNYDTNDIGSPIELLQNTNSGKLYCDSVNKLIMVSYTDSILSSVFIYDKETYYLNLPIGIEIPDGQIDLYGYGIQVEINNSNNAFKSYMVSSGYLQKFYKDKNTMQSDVSMISDKISFNLNGFNFIDTYNNRSKSCQNVLLYTSGN